MATNEIRSSARQGRPQNAVYMLPRDWDSLDQVLVPLVERIDPLNAAPQLLIVTPDVESTVGLVAGAFARLGVQGVDVLPATGAARAARLLRTDPARAVAGPPWVLRQLVTASALRLDAVRAVLFAWLDDVIEEGTEALADLESVLGEVPKEAARTLVARGTTAAIDKFTERHMLHARRVGSVGSAVESRLPVSYVTTPRSTRTAALRRVLDETDPPSATVLARDDKSEEEARAALRQLGYRRADDVVRVSRGDVPANTHTVIFYDVPLNAAPLDIVAESRPTRVIVLVEPREIDALRRVTGGRATPLERSEAIPHVRRADELLQKQVRQVLDGGFGRREISAIEPLLSEYDAVEIAGALVRILEVDREQLAKERAAARGGDRREHTGAHRVPRDAARPRDETRPRSETRPRGEGGRARGEGGRPRSEGRPRADARPGGDSRPRRDERPRGEARPYDRKRSDRSRGDERRGGADRDRGRGPRR